MKAEEIVNKTILLQKQFNKLLQRFNNATAYLENSNLSDEEVERWLPEYHKIYMEMKQVCHNIEELCGFNVTAEEFLGGFKDALSEQTDLIRQQDNIFQE